MRDLIIGEIKRLAAENGGKAPGQQAFATATGIRASKWHGRYWARWGDALVDAGFEPNAWTGKSDTNSVLGGVIQACRHYGHFPTNAEISILRQCDQRVPAPRTIKNIVGGRADLVAALRAFTVGKPEYADVVAMLPTMVRRRPARPIDAKGVDGSVYMLKSGAYYKIGRSDQLERRVKEIRTALPDAATLVHSIMTDDPPGIEAYWHRRFADRRKNGEWFELAPEDVKAFVRRKFQ